MSDSPPAHRLSLFALLSVILGLAGPPGVLAGYLGLYRINASDGRLRGRYLAYAGIVLGLFATIALVLGLVAVGLTQLWAVNGRVECTNNMRQIGAAVQAYHGDHDKVYPRGSFGADELPPERRLSFHAGILKYVEQRPGVSVKYSQVATSLDFQQPWDTDVHKTALQTTIPTYLCRDDVGVLLDHRGQTNYVGITGIGPAAARLPTDSPRAGFLGYDREVRDADIKAGTSYLVMLTETTVDNGPWLAAGRPTLRDVPMRDMPLQAACVVGAATDAQGPLLAAQLLSLTAASDESYFGPGRPFGGLHRGGANVLHVDGSVLFLNDTIHQDVFRSLILLQHEKQDVVEPP